MAAAAQARLSAASKLLEMRAHSPVR